MGLFPVSYGSRFTDRKFWTMLTLFSSLVRHARRLSPARSRSAVLVTTAAMLAGTGMVSIISTAAPANAAATATISRDITLAATSFGVATDPAGTNGDDGLRTIFLAQGTYTWGYSITKTGTTATDSRTIFLDAGTYLWNCQLGGTGNSFPGADNYRTICTLTPDNPNLDSAFIPANARTAPDLFDLPPGTYFWKSFLIPHF